MMPSILCLAIRFHFPYERDIWPDSVVLIFSKKHANKSLKNVGFYVRILRILCQFCEL